MVLDNIPFAAAMVPVIRELSLQNGAPLAPLAWSLALGTDIGGSATPIGASANVVGLAVAEKSGLRVHWPEYLRVAVPATLLTIGVCNLLLWIRYA
jgi:Na+/H+ antiporter NhaD/arsenite permease-like protein